MSSDLAIYLLFAGVIAFSIVRALRKGRVGFGHQTVDRASEPTKFNFYLCLMLLVGVLLAIEVALGRLGDGQRSPLTSNASNLLIGAIAGFYFWKALVSGEALDPAFSKVHEPVQYWAIVSLLLLGAIFFTGSYVVIITSL